LSALFHDRLKEIILFGSYARGDFQKGSDIDLLLLLDRISATLPERDKYFSVVCDLSLKYDTVLSVIPMDIETFETRKSPLILNIWKEGRRI
jgi:predicted nucleotidyltransferase